MLLEALLMIDAEAFPRADIPRALGALDARLRLRLEASNGESKHVGLMNPGRVAKLLGVKVHFVYERARRRKLKAVRLGNQIRFTMDDVERFIEERREPEG